MTLHRSNEDLYEQLAAIEHERWADWQKYLHSKCVRLDNGNLVIPVKQVEHWERQIVTPYAELTEQEKQSDREQVDRYWHLIEESWVMPKEANNEPQKP